MKIYVSIANPFSGIASFQKISKPYFGYFWQKKSDVSIIIINNIRFEACQQINSVGEYYYSSFLDENQFNNIKDLIDMDYFQDSMNVFANDHTKYFEAFKSLINEKF
jgi:hypothetical protein